MELQHAFCTCSSNCHCRETNVYEWVWDQDYALPNAILSEDNLDVMFHTKFCSGTAGIRGNKLLEKGRHHYWEIKMLSSIDDTVIIGVGTNRAVLHNDIQFRSLLGCDQESFGLSYKGYTYHDGVIRIYSTKFGKGSLIGVHLNTWRGTLEFFINRKPFGIAFTGLQNIALYPMVSCVATSTRMRLTHSSSVPVSLQLECLTILSPAAKAHLIAKYPPLHYLLRSIFAKILHKDLIPISDDSDDASNKDQHYCYMCCEKKNCLKKNAFINPYKQGLKETVKMFNWF